ncbi:hypothetical protein [Thetidibacter halocola]|uniref:Uncharacterized protein n=1 Tax=Thetidibacter halocola TaxID=2827239 RepID=A0A8J7WB49_9RHOB|nr:hypothetical protein [Thetidibacter halocola]MBS0124315.1 hypothetical protein [Thetidibacter halocola]
MAHGKTGAAKAGGKAPRHDTGKGAPKVPEGKAARGGKSSRAELLARMKAVADARKDA